MLTNFTRRHYAITASLCGAFSIGIYLIMINVTLAHLQAVSGRVPFDMRPFGYSEEDALQLLSALGEKGRAYYFTRQIPLDLFYPALLATTLVSANLWFGSNLPNKKTIYVGTVFAGVAAVADYAENLGISLMILNWPTVPTALIQTSSLASNVKALGTTLAALTTLLIMALWVTTKVREGRFSRAGGSG